MPGLPSNERVYERIALFCCPPSTRHLPTLHSLCLTSKLFRRVAEPYLYARLFFFDPLRTHSACRTISTRPELGLHVQTFCHYPDLRKFPQLPQMFWITMRKAIGCMKNLDCLMISDDGSFSHSWTLPAPTDASRDRMPSQIREIKLRMLWDEHVLKFLQHQKNVKQIQIVSIFAVQDKASLTPVLAAPSLSPSVQVFDGQFPAVWYFCHCPLTHLQVTLPEMKKIPDGSLLPLFQRLASAHKTLRSLSLVEVASDDVSDITSAAARYTPQIRHLGILPLPMRNRHTFLQPLMYLHDLISIELDLSGWSGYIAGTADATAYSFIPSFHPMYHPSPSAFRALACELKTFCPTLMFVTFWVGYEAFNRVRWCYNATNNEWNSRNVEGGLSVGLNPTTSGLWRSI